MSNFQPKKQTVFDDAYFAAIEGGGPVEAHPWLSFGRLKIKVCRGGCLYLKRRACLMVCLKPNAPCVSNVNHSLNQ